MKRTYTDDGWRKRFAFLPFTLSDGPNKTFIWLETYWAKDMSIYTEISLTDPRQKNDL